MNQGALARLLSLFGVLVVRVFLIFIFELRLEAEIKTEEFSLFTT